MSVNDTVEKKIKNSNCCTNITAKSKTYSKMLYHVSQGPR